MLAQNVRFYGMAQWLGGDIFDQSLCVLGREDTDLCVHQVARCDVIMFWMVLNTVTWCLERKNTLNSSFSSASRRHRKRCAKPKTVVQTKTDNDDDLLGPQNLAPGFVITIKFRITYGNRSQTPSELRTAFSPLATGDENP
jgi:hypothetical protein